MRHFIRHPASIPIELDTCCAGIRAHASNVSVGGLAFDSAEAVGAGEVVALKIPLVSPAFEAMARVMWCHPKRGGYELGVAFLDQEDAFRARMVEQVCHIEEYKQAMLRIEQRKLTSQQAAREWIDKYAAQFPLADSEPTANETRQEPSHF